MGARWYGEETVQPGDCNDDGISNIIDIVLVINDCILGSESDCECGDLNQDGIINVLDIVQLVNQILTP
ncbi:MAG: dockerin type I repeat-containing protein [Candidatus Marinimicrobia bacterium]|nr:dockerin type I repeat-containing protein [Candidatus Neomarinimicrobiota bacterium]